MLTCSSMCPDVKTIKHFQKIKVNDKKIRMIMISESVPMDTENYFDGKKDGTFISNTNTLFNNLGYNFHTYKDYLDNGIYLTTAIKCAKKDYLVSAATIKECSSLLEIESFTNVEVMMLMGDFAIKSINYIWKRKFNEKVIPAGSTYKIRKQEFVHNGVRFFPSYTQTGDSFGIEKSKIKMMQEDLEKAMAILGKK
jgi:uracil-DNA glycosylase